MRRLLSRRTVGGLVLVAVAAAALTFVAGFASAGSPSPCDHIPANALYHIPANAIYHIPGCK